MTSMTDAGALYLNDYYILSEARKEMDQFLNHVVTNVHAKLIEELKLIPDDIIKWTIWINQTSLGYMQITAIATKQISKPIYIIYRDIRNTSSLTDPKSIELSISTIAEAKQLKLDLNRLSQKMFSYLLTDPIYPTLNLSSSEESVDTIVSVILNRCNQLIQIIQTM